MKGEKDGNGGRGGKGAKREKELYGERKNKKKKKRKRKRKEEKEYTSDIINDFSVIIGVFTDLESVVDLSTTVFTLAASVNM